MLSASGSATRRAMSGTTAVDAVEKAEIDERKAGDPLVASESSGPSMSQRVDLELRRVCWSGEPRRSVVRSSNEYDVITSLTNSDKFPTLESSVV